MNTILPIDTIEYSQVVKYEKLVNRQTKFIKGVQLRPNYYYEYLSYNNFANKEKKIPNGYTKVDISEQYIKEFLFDKTKTILKKDSPEYKAIINKHQYSTSYFTQWNGGCPFVVYINDYNNLVDIYKLPSDKYFGKGEFDRSKNFYVELVASYQPIQIFIGTSPLNKMTVYSGDHGPYFDGNTILLKISEIKYVFIGTEVYEFETDDNIKIYYSPVGNSAVPYPFAIGEKYIYFMLDYCCLSQTKNNNCIPLDTTDAYTYFYDHDKKYNLKNKIEPMHNVRVVCEHID